MLRYYLYRLAGLGIPLLPPRLGYWFFARLGDAAYLLGYRARRIVADNLRHVLGTPAEKKLVRQVFRNLLMNYFDLFRIPVLKYEQVAAMTTLIGLEQLDAAHAVGRGVIIVSAHLGNTEILMQLPVLYPQYKIAVLAERLKPERMFHYIRRLREKRGTRLIPVDAVLEIYRALRRNETLGVAADREVTGTGEWVEFFGAPAFLPNGYVELALRTGAQIVVGVGWREAENRFMAQLERVPLEQTGDLARDRAVNHRKILQVVERHIRARPEQWVMFQPLWGDGG